MNAKQTIPILICTGHTGGHFFPAASFAQTFQSVHPEVEIHMLMNRIPSFANPSQAEHLFRFHLISFSPPPSFFSFKMFSFLIQCGVAFVKTFALFLKVKPKLVIGFGSFASVPGVLWAAIFGISVMLHEQNAVAGRGNQLLGMCADRIGISFPETAGRLSREKLFWSGYPLRSSFWNGGNEAPRDQLGKKSFTILVFGGSQGAKRLNAVFLEALALLRAEERNNLVVIHSVGHDDLYGIQQTYENLGIQANVCTFSGQIFEHFQRADLVISRAGAGTIFELAAVGRAAILIPYPHAYAHQKVNAEYLVQRSSARVIYDEELSAPVLHDVILELRDDVNQKAQLSQNIKRLAKKDASEVLVEAGWRLICAKD